MTTALTLTKRNLFDFGISHVERITEEEDVFIVKTGPGSLLVNSVVGQEELIFGHAL